MSQTYFISRHPGAQDWARRQGIRARFVEHLDLEMIAPGDTVLGTLPVHLAAEVCRRGARFFCLVLRVPQALRGHELDANQFEQLTPRLTAYSIRELNDEFGHRPD